MSELAKKYIPPEEIPKELLDAPSSETKEGSRLETFKKEYNELLNTPCFDFFQEEFADQDPTKKFHHTELATKVFDALEKKLEELTNLESKETTIKLLTDLFDQTLDSDFNNPPPLFKLSKRECYLVNTGTMDEETKHLQNSDYERYELSDHSCSEDIMSQKYLFYNDEEEKNECRQNPDIFDSSYKTFYLHAIINILKKLDADSHLMIELCKKIRIYEYNQEKQNDEGPKKTYTNFEELPNHETTDPHASLSLIKNEAKGHPDIRTPWFYWDYETFGEFPLVKSEIIKSLLDKESIDPEVMDFLLKWLKKDPDNYEANIKIIMDIFNKNPSLAADHLLKIIRNKEESDFTKRVAFNNLLYLEFGKIGISRDGLIYLGKKYDLKEFNNENFFAHRCTKNGEIAIFDEEKKVVGYFQLEDLESPDNTKATVINFTIETLFYAKPDETPEEKKEREKILEEFKNKYFDTYLKDFYEKTGVHFNNLSFKEQGWFLWFLNNITDSEKEQLFNFISTYKENGLRTFLSLEHSKDTGLEIIKLGENLEPELAEKVFSIYSKLIDKIEDVEKIINDFFTNTANTDLEENRVTYEISRRASLVLQNFIEQSQNRDPKDIELTELKTELEKINIDLITFLSVFKSAFQNKEKIDFSEVRGLDFKAISGNELSSEDKANLFAVFSKNYTHEPEFIERFHEFLHPTTSEGEEKLAKNKFYILNKFDENKKTNTTLSFLRLEDLPNGHKYFAACNVNRDFQGAGIGGQVIQQSVGEASKTQQVDATFPPQSVIGTFYIDKVGFVATGFKMEMDKYPRFVMEAGPDTSDKFLTKQNLEFYSQERLKLYLVEESELDEALSDNRRVVAIKYDSENQMTELGKSAQKMFDSGYIMTRNFCAGEDKRCNKKIYVFEKNDASNIEEENKEGNILEMTPNKSK